ncbi:ABC transporter, permease protein [Enterococcus italicus DSM 15952]|uniref:ABC transporter, permease protein n=2 Tax=Enterococcus italicus TaxID=246144 RepID=E6LF22_ENTI1|nr:ABC transporter, permease protein [Enterococcus italicus DSM 15952]OJG59911.1 polar amino acid ABC transporter permease [Enterococcus italicus DSM 15952]HCS30837.1 polar amino acid ABC transporter permease [Enterococcus sp.]
MKKRKEGIEMKGKGKQHTWLKWGMALLAFVISWQLSTTVHAQEKQVVIVGTSGQTKPMDYFNDKNELTGFEIDVLKEIESRSDTITFQFETAEFASLFAGLDSKKFDLVVNNLGESGDRRKKYLFSLYPYIVTHNVLITKTDQPDNLTVADLKGKSIAVVPASPQSQFLEAWNKENPDDAVTIQYVDSDPSQIIRDVYSGKFDATIYATTYVHDVEQTFGIQLKQHTIENEDQIRQPGSYFIFRKDELTLRNEMDEILAEMREDGTLTKISMKYLGQDDIQLTKALIEKNDKLNEENATTSDSDTAQAETNETTDGKLFVPSLIPSIIAQLLPKLPITLLMTVVSAIIGLGLGFLIAVVKIRNTPVLTQICSVFVSFMRGTPQLVQLFLSFYGFPILVEWLSQQMGVTANVNAIPALVYVFIAFGLNEAAYTSETFRAALLSVNKNEIEAARSIGLTNVQTMMRIILPSALIVALPNLVNSFISLLKATSLAFTVTIIDIMGQTRIIAGANLRFFEAYIAVALVYWVMCLLIEQVAKRIERKLNVDL